MTPEEIAGAVARWKEARRMYFAKRDERLAILEKEWAIEDEKELELERKKLEEKRKTELINDVCAMLELWQGLKFKEFDVNPIRHDEARFFLHLPEEVWKMVLFREDDTEQNRCKIRLLADVIRDDKDKIKAGEPKSV